MDRGTYLDAYKRESVTRDAGDVPSPADIMERHMAMKVVAAFTEWKLAGKPSRR